MQNSKRSLACFKFPCLLAQDCAFRPQERQCAAWARLDCKDCRCWTCQDLEGWVAVNPERGVYILPFDPSASILMAAILHTALLASPRRSQAMHKETQGLSYFRAVPVRWKCSIFCRGPTQVRNRECATHGYHAKVEWLLMSVCLSFCQ